jgi:hypothetical protein
MSPLWKLFPDVAFVPVIAALFVLGVVLIILYVVSTVGPYLRYISVGLLTAFAAFLVGVLVGLVLAIPRVVSSGAYRHLETGERGQEPTEMPRVLPSTNLAEISDWLTKLLLGAGLVSLTRLGRPLSQLIDNIARGLGGGTASGGVTASAGVLAGAILITYVVLGFLGGYLTTAFFYGIVCTAAPPSTTLPGWLPEDGDVVADAAEQPQYPPSSTTATWRPSAPIEGGARAMRKVLRPARCTSVTGVLR